MDESELVQDAVTAVLSNEGAVFWCSSGWRRVANQSGVWQCARMRTPIAATSLVGFISQCLEGAPSAKPFPVQFCSDGRPAATWSVEITPLAGTVPHLFAVGLVAELAEGGSDDVPGVVLLVDDEPNIINALKRSLRRCGYTLLSADSGATGLAVLDQQPVDVIISDQRMPGMSGVEFLRQAHQRWPETIRISLSGYTDLQSVTDAINEGAIYKFITKPWEDVALIGTVEDAFARKRNEDRTRRLQQALAIKNAALRDANEQLNRLLAQQQREVETGEASLAVTHETFSVLPVAVIGADADGLVVVANDAAEMLVGAHVLGSYVREALPAAITALLEEGSQSAQATEINGRTIIAIRRPLHGAKGLRGNVLTLISREDLQP